jgi:hypothetical protein
MSIRISSLVVGCFVGFLLYAGNSQAQWMQLGDTLNNSDIVLEDEVGVCFGCDPALSILHIEDTSPILKIESANSGSATISNGKAGLELIVGTMTTFYKYGNAIKFMSDDSSFSTDDHAKFLAAIVPRATESYSADTDGGMALDFFTTPNNPGAGGTPSFRMTINQDGYVGIGDSTPSCELDVNGELSADGIRTYSSGTYVPNIKMGKSTNSICAVSASCEGNVIGGGSGQTIGSYCDYATIGGGSNNLIYSHDWSTISGGVYNSTIGHYVSVGGGYDNDVNGGFGAVAGGRNNDISFSDYGSICGGYDNIISSYASYAAIGGGHDNTVTGDNATIPGGYNNTASADYSFAAGTGAVADEYSSFVWSAVGEGCNSSASYQFRVCAPNGAWFSDNVSALSYTDRTPYPETLEEAYLAVLSMARLPAEVYDPDNETNQLDHSTLTDFVYAEDADGNPGRNLSATVSAQNEVIKDLVVRNAQLEQRLLALELALGVR